MFVIIGIAVVTISVVGGFMFAGGDVVLLIQPAEFIVIVGAAVGSLLISAPMGVIKKIIKTIPGVFKSHAYSKEEYLELLKAFNDLFLLAQREGLLAIEKHIETPEESDILSKSPRFLQNELAKTFFCDTMKVMLSGGVPPHELENLIDAEIGTLEAETKPAINAITKMGDAFPGLGIVAAVLGIIITMGSIDEGAAVVGHHVAAALVGTFLGVLIAYGFVGPLATNLEVGLEEKMRYLETIKACVVAYAKGNPPIIAVEIARRTIFSEERPTFSELENFMRGKTE
ncbi:MAG: flagellar motor stator protein MotA [Ignavibacteriaceae bacterium]|nr:flagellar motor stator protein MotA [Ignavibacterium sp.]MCC6256009.1 flagellar motor stator protein MotA [Ignavibacteriaceae bacterium]HRN25651.1 flagellar motor stator protein MotA [Ignavibacteriaceae bacterium]HRP91703.1 flagellar motor stator protein MotA [Ignavibacteriaceae bacterium]HRQ53327.1 flagellar motor stator protein MotA [Ignavibacteriaceae bacterium]